MGASVFEEDVSDDFRFDRLEAVLRRGGETGLGGS